MSQPPVNPYAPPSTVGKRLETASPKRSLAIAAVSALGTIAFMAFTLVLLFSTPGDRKVGMMFLFNVPILIGMTITALYSCRISYYCATAGAIVQLIILMIMLAWNIGDVPIVVGVNALIIFPCVAIALWAWLRVRLSASLAHSTVVDE